MNNHSYRYFAFISYQRNDEEIARWLHHQLEHYRLPVNIIKDREGIPKEMRPLFLDEAELSSGNLSEAISQALSDSKNLIVLCSPNSAKSSWVNKEVQTFIESDRTNMIFPVIIDGVPYSGVPETECFPEALKSLRNSPKERLGINMKNGLEIASVKLISALLGVNFDQLWQRYEREKEEERQRLINEKHRLQRLESRYLAEKAEELLNKMNSASACLLALRALPADLSDPEDRPYVPEVEAILRKATTYRDDVLHGHTAGVASVASSLDGKLLASASLDGTIKIWDIDSGAQLHSLTVHKGNVNSVCFSQDGACILTASSDGTVKITDIKSNDIKLSLDQLCKASCAVFSYNGKYIASGDEEGTICIWKAETGSLCRELTGHEKWVSSVRFSQSGKYILSASEDGTVKIWNVKNGSCVRTFEVHSGPVNSAEFSRDERSVLSAGDDRTIKVWNSDTGEVMQTLTGHEDVVASAQYSRDEKFILSASWDKTIRIWDAKSGNEIRIYKGHTLAVSTARFSNDGSFIISASWDQTIRLWNFRKRQEECILDDRSGFQTLYSMAFCNDSRHIITSSNNKDIRLWDIKTRSSIRTYTGHTGTIRHIAVSPDGKMFASASEDKTIKLWEFDKEEAITTFTGHLAPVNHVSFTTDGKYLLSASMDHYAMVWDISKGKIVQWIPGGQEVVEKVFYDQKHKEIIATTMNRILIYDAETLDRKKLMRVRTNAISSPHISHFHNRRLILDSGTGDGSLAIWNMDTETIVRVIPNKHNDPIHYAEFSDDGKYILSTAHRGGVKVSDAESGEDIWSFHSDNGSMTSLVFSPDKKHLAACGADGKIHIYPFQPLQELIDKTRERFINRELSEELKKRYYID
ncbi:MAG: TIR domain-containing protein [Candidatus Cryptobacteroides sp.]